MKPGVGQGLLHCLIKEAHAEVTYDQKPEWCEDEHFSQEHNKCPKVGIRWACIKEVHMSRLQ